MRACGILAHISSLPSDYGIGTLGSEAHAFVDFLSAAGQSFWQLLPVGPTSYGDSPYQSPSAYAGNPYFVDLEELYRQGLLKKQELEQPKWGKEPGRVDYGALFANRERLLRRAFSRDWPRCREEVISFLRNNPWAEEYALFMTLKQRQQQRAWHSWPKELRQEQVLRHCRDAFGEDIRFYIYVQYRFSLQWQALRDYAHQKGISIIGDVPIYVPYDSVEVWQQPELFQLDENRCPTAVAGCPPDGFSAQGQLWGNPLYDWDRMEKNGYLWWVNRLKRAGELFDVIRLDHFRGIESYWSIPAQSKTAADGEWEKGPGSRFIDDLKKELPEQRFIVEDLGYLTPEVIELVRSSGYPGMKVLQFAFDSREPGNYLPESYLENSVCYVGTHDNPPLRQWVEELPAQTLERVMDYAGLTEREQVPQALLQMGLQSKSELFVTQLQDYLDLGADSRMNVPGTLSPDNWSWRLLPEQLSAELAARIHELTAKSGRLPQKPQ